MVIWPENIWSDNSLCHSVNGVWGPWSMWSACTTSCGPGTRERKRSCNSPAPSNGGKPCSGAERQVGDCSYRPCPGKELLNNDWTWRPDGKRLDEVFDFLWFMNLEFCVSSSSGWKLHGMDWMDRLRQDLWYWSYDAMARMLKPSSTIWRQGLFIVWIRYRDEVVRYKGLLSK